MGSIAIISHFYKTDPTLVGAFLCDEKFFEKFLGRMPKSSGEGCFIQ